MINFSPTLSSDLDQIGEWIKADPYHQSQGNAEWWLGDGAKLAFCLMDDKGPLTYVRIDEEGEYLRLHTQFAPVDIVHPRRLIVGMIEAMSRLTIFYGAEDWKGFVFQSISPALIGFMSKRFGFEAIGSNDYRMAFEGKE